MLHQSRVRRQVLQAGRLLGGHDQHVDQILAWAGQVDQVNVRKHRLERGGQHLDQAPVGARAPHIDGHHPLIGQVIVYLFKELAGGQVKGNVGRPVGIDGDDVVRVLAIGQKVAPVLGHRVKVGLVHVKILAAHPDDLGVDLGAVDGDRPVDRRVLLGHRARRRADEGQAVDLVGRMGGIIKIGRDQEIVPDAAHQHRIGIVDRVDALPLVELEPYLVTPLQHLDVIVGRLGLVDQFTIFRRLDHPPGQGHDQDHQHCRQNQIGQRPRLELHKEADQPHRHQ